MSAGRRSGSCALLLLLAGCGSCKGHAAGDAGPEDATEVAEVQAVGPVVVTHAPTGLELMAPPTWRRSLPAGVEGGSAGDEADREGTIADLRRPAERGAPTLAAPRLVVIAETVSRPLDIERALDRETDGLRTLQSNGALTMQRSARSRRLLGGVDLGELRVDYSVAHPGGGDGASVVHRTWMGGRRASDGTQWAITIVLTYLFADEDLIAREVEDVLKSIHFAAPAAEVTP